MAKIQIPRGTAWKEFEMKTDLILPPVVRLKIRPTFKRDLIRKIFKGGRFTDDDSGVMEAGVAHVFDLIEDWDLEDDSGPIECTAENKKKWLDPLLWEIVVDKEGAEARPVKWLWFYVLEFSKEFNNFTKN